jgi:hypothetical protein
MERPSETDGADAGGGDPLTCPWCGSTEVELIAEFGAELLVSPYLCLRCRSPFDAIRKRDGDPTDRPRAPEG